MQNSHSSASSSDSTASSAASNEPVPPKRPVMKVSWQTLNENHVPLWYRDYCAHEWIPLNNCRLREGPFPWTCEHEKHNYEVCSYEVYQYRMALKEYLIKVGKWNKGRFPESDAVKY